MSSTNSSTVASPLKYTSVTEIPAIHERARKAFRSGRLRDIEFRKDQLLRLANMVKDNAKQIDEALLLDMGRPALEASFERTAILTEAMTAYNNISQWTMPEKPPFDFRFFALKPIIHKTPKGVVLVIGPFNYPLGSTLTFLIGAIAAGCACVVKMSEHAPHVAALITEQFPKYMDNELFHVVNGAIPETSTLLDLKWDHIVFTGSTAVGKVVAAAAAKHLTPVTLELGGQCPVFVDSKYDMKLAAKRLLWAKAFNAGQACTAPNHIFVHADKQDMLVEGFKEAFTAFFPDGAEKSASLAHLINEPAYKRNKELIEKTKGTVVIGGGAVPEEKIIAPAIVKDVKFGDALLEHELFGPIMPIVPVKDMQDAIDYTNDHPHALAAYAFSDDDKFKNFIRDNTQSGGFGVNDCSIHVAVPGLPFGGVGDSGIGMVREKYSFDTFTHFRASIDSPRFLDTMMGWRFPPYTDAKLKQQSSLIPTVPPIGGYTWSGWLRSWIPF